MRGGSPPRRGAPPRRGGALSWRGGAPAAPLGLREEAVLAEAALEAECTRLCAADGREELATDKLEREVRERESAPEAEERKYNA